MSLYRWTALVVALVCSGSGLAMPRPPGPPLPERQLTTWRFDDAAWVARPTSNALAARHLALAESWSGYALDTSGEQSSLLALPLFSSTGKPHVTANAGTVRFWFAPAWSSKSAGGSGPGEWARLFEVSNPSDEQQKFWITLAIDPTGSILTLASKAEHGPPVYLQAAVQWQAGQWHQVHAVYSPTNTLLVVDGALAAATENGIAWPGAAQWPELAFSLGSGLDGEDIARGQFEELTTFAFPLSLEYMAWHYGQYAGVAAMGPVTEQERIAARQQRSESELTFAATSSSEPPPAPGPGGGGGGGGVTFPPPPPGLKLTRPMLAGVSLATTLAEADTNSAYDIFQKLGLQPTNTWSRVAMGDIGQTNFTLNVPSTNHAFFIAAAVVDSDFDGLPDAYEELILGTSPLSPDTNGDGVPDGNADRDGNGLPDYVDYNGLTRAVIYATRTNAFEGGQAGEITVRLPSSAPTNNTRVVLHLGGRADYDGDYWLAKLDGTRVTNDLFFVIGEREIRLQVHVNNDTVQASFPRKVSVALAESANYQLDPQRADVTLVDNDLPAVTVFANDHKAGEPNLAATLVANPGAFILRRDGMLTNALTVNFSVSGSATGGIDYTNFTSPIVMPIGSNVVTIPVNPIHDTNYEGDENVIVTLQSSASYSVDPVALSATVTIADNDLPLVYFVGTDLVATEYDSLKAATVTLRRTGNNSRPLTVPLSISGSATTNDYQALNPRSVTFAAGASNAVINVRPLSDPLEEQVETVILTLKGGRGYAIGSSNMVTVVIDDNYPTRYERLQLKQSAIYDPLVGVDAPFVGEIRRWGRSSAAINFGFIVHTNTAQGAKPTSFYRVTGDVSGTNLVFPAFATKARLNLSAPMGVPRFAGGVDILFPSLTIEVWSAFYQPTWQYMKFSVVETNAVEGGSTVGRFRVSRNVTAPTAISESIEVTGQARPAGFTNSDHTLPGTFFMTLASNAYSADVTFTAGTDSVMEGWESIVFTPVLGNVEIVFDYGARFMLSRARTSPIPNCSRRAMPTWTVCPIVGNWPTASTL